MDAIKELANPEYSNYSALITEHNHFTFKELDAYSDTCAQIILDHADNLGLSLYSSPVLICFQNQAMQFMASIAALKIKICHLSSQSGMAKAKKHELISQANVKFAVSDIPIDQGIPVLQLTLDILKNYKNKHSINIQKHIPPIKNNSIAIIVPGSGTTGKSKLIAIDFDNFNKLIARDLIARPIHEKEHHLSFTPIEFYTAKRRNLACLQVGGCVVLREHFNSDLLSLVKKYSIEHLSFASSHAKELVQMKPEISKSIFSHTKTLFLGGSPISETLRKKIKKNITENLYIAYGTNEMGECCIASPELQSTYPNCIGIFLPSVEAEIVDENNKRLPTNTIGILRIRSNASYSHYINSDKLNLVSKTHNTQLKKGTWFYPGDFASISEKRLATFKGRSDDAITYNGTMIYPREIEQHMEAIQEVHDVAAFAIDIEDNQLPAIVFTASRKLNKTNVAKYLQSKLGWLSPKYIQQVSEMPRNEAGKILKRELKNFATNEINNQKNN
jgi:long-chain acyl-CoA synthetase